MTFGCSFLESMCSNQIDRNLVSPDGEYVATVFHRDCGATTGFSTQVALREKDDDFDHSEGLILSIADEHPLALRWASSRHLSILVPKSRTYRLETRWNDVSIEYTKVDAARSP
jgi:hypothetical protein